MGRALDIGCGAGPGGIALAQHACVQELVLADINPRALVMPKANAAVAGMPATTMLSDLFDSVRGSFDCIVANPPYLNDTNARTCRHGGGDWGTGLSVRIVGESLARLSPGGSLLLYTGSPVVDDVDRFKVQVSALLQASGWHWTYRELDPDVFGEELANERYRDVERIAAIGLTVRRPD